MYSKKNATELLELVEDFISGNISAIEFEKIYYCMAAL